MLYEELLKALAENKTGNDFERKLSEALVGKLAKATDIAATVRHSIRYMADTPYCISGPRSSARPASFLSGENGNPSARRTQHPDHPGIRCRGCNARVPLHFCLAENGNPSARRIRPPGPPWHQVGRVHALPLSHVLVGNKVAVRAEEMFPSRISIEANVGSRGIAGDAQPLAGQSRLRRAWRWMRSRTGILTNRVGSPQVLRLGRVGRSINRRKTADPSSRWR